MGFVLVEFVIVPQHCLADAPSGPLSTLFVPCWWLRPEGAGRWEDTEVDWSVAQGVDVERDDVIQMKVWRGRLGEPLNGIINIHISVLSASPLCLSKKHKASETSQNFWSLTFSWHSAYREGALCDFSFSLSPSSCLQQLSGMIYGVMASLLLWVLAFSGNVLYSSC